MPAARRREMPEARPSSRVLVTGGAGFIGSHLCARLLERGDEVVVLDDLSTGKRENLAEIDAANLSFVEGSVLDTELVDELVAASDRVFHLAAAVGVRLILDEPVRTLETNVEGTRAVLGAAARHGVRALFASSSEVYGRSDELPFQEDAAVVLGATSEPRWSYACSKAFGEWLAFAHARADGLDVRIVRFFNIVGQRQRGRYGMVLPNFVRQALADEPITVFGDGQQTRCFLHVGDAVDAVVRLSEEPRARGRVFNVGATREVAIGDLAALVRSELGSASPIVRMPYREAYGMSITDLPRRVPDVARLHACIGFTPRVSLEAAIHDVAEYEQSPRVTRRSGR